RVCLRYGPKTSSSLPAEGARYAGVAEDAAARLPLPVAGLRLCCQARRWVSLLSRADGNREGPAEADVTTAGLGTRSPGRLRLNSACAGFMRGGWAAPLGRTVQRSGIIVTSQSC